ncbi:MAG: fumarylacetoacetate hydrolase family protein [Bryobacteraceae bacterium]|nr:fumarylacetoacetate hydrolase family protein [Bryobacteraceae bacterium]MDW8378844.1 fumarylacetoacetate hydrolase family protein [Bryobacterales bacterium]
MKLGQIRWNHEVTAAVFENGLARPIPGYTLQGLIERSEKEGIPLAELAARRAASHGEAIPPIIPLHPREVWACGCTYETSASFRDSEHGTREGFYAYVYREARPEIFLKGTARVCVGPDKPIGIRADSKFTAPEPELALVLGPKGIILGFTIANDVSAWDIERENPLYLPQSKIYSACCALGPVIVTPDEIPDPYNLEITCTIRRGDRVVFSGGTSTAKLHRKFETLIEYLYRSNPVPSGSVLCTGTGIIVREDAALQPGDVCSITIQGLGELSNPCAVVE